MTGNRFLPKLHLRHQGFIHITSGPFTKDFDLFVKFKETCDFNYIYKNELEKSFFHVMLHMLTVKIYLEELFETIFFMIRLMKLL